MSNKLIQLSQEDFLNLIKRGFEAKNYNGVFNLMQDVIKQLDPSFEPEPKINKYSLSDLQILWNKLWLEMFNTIVEPDEAYETATVLQEFVRRIEKGEK